MFSSQITSFCIELGHITSRGLYSAYILVYIYKKFCIYAHKYLTEQEVYSASLGIHLNASLFCLDICITLSRDGSNLHNCQVSPRQTYIGRVNCRLTQMGQSPALTSGITNTFQVAKIKILIYNTDIKWLYILTKPISVLKLQSYIKYFVLLSNLKNIN